MSADSIETPIVTIGLPVYNGEATVVRAIESVLRQTYRQFELIISDNCSTDQTLARCLEFAARDQRVIVLRQPKNRGAIANFNAVFAAARGRYFKAISSLDLIEPTFLEAGVHVLEQSPETVLFYSHVDLIDEAGHRVGTSSDVFALDESDPVERFIRLHATLRGNNAFYGLIRTSALRRTRYLGLFLSSDVVTMAELSLRGRFYLSPETLMMRHRENNRIWDLRDRLHELEFCTGEKPTGRPPMVFWRLQFEYVRTAYHTTLSLPDRGRLFWYLAKNWYWSRFVLWMEVRQQVVYFAGLLFGELPPEIWPM